MATDAIPLFLPQVAWVPNAHPDIFQVRRNPESRPFGDEHRTLAMNHDTRGFEPPEDRLFHYLTMQATRRKLDVYGASH